VAGKDDKNSERAEVMRERAGEQQKTKLRSLARSFVPSFASRATTTASPKPTTDACSGSSNCSCSCSLVVAAMVSLRRGVPLLVVLVGTLLLLLLLIGNGVEASTSTTTSIVWVGSLPPPSYCAELPLCGSNSTCYCTSIQQAIDTIADLQPAAAYQILVLPGEYYGTSNTQLQLPALKNVSLVYVG